MGVFPVGPVATDKPLVADFDGDGKSDLVVYRPSDGSWYIRFSTSNYSSSNSAVYQWGLPTDIPLPSDFDGDARTDLVVYRPSSGEWFIRYSSAAYRLRVFPISVGSCQRRADRAADALTRRVEPGAPSPQLSAGPSTCFHGANAFFTPSSERPSCG